MRKTTPQVGALYRGVVPEFCRWCDSRLVFVPNGGLLCRKCDR